MFLLFFRPQMLFQVSPFSLAASLSAFDSFSVIWTVFWTALPYQHISPLVPPSVSERWLWCCQDVCHSVNSSYCHRNVLTRMGMMFPISFTELWRTSIGAPTPRCWPRDCLWKKLYSPLLPLFLPSHHIRSSVHLRSLTNVDTFSKHF